jgi:hypothetical protein
MPLIAFRRVQIVLAIGGLAFVGLGCSATTAPVPRPVAQHVGVVTGIASPCWPYARSKGIGKAPVEVTVTRHGERVTSQTVRGDHVYHFELSPGNYAISTLYSTARPVTTATGSTVKIDLPDDCV